VIISLVASAVLCTVSFHKMSHVTLWREVSFVGDPARMTAPSLMQNGGFRPDNFFGGEYEYGVYMICNV